MEPSNPTYVCNCWFLKENFVDNRCSRTYNCLIRAQKAVARAAKVFPIADLVFTKSAGDINLPFMSTFACVCITLQQHRYFDEFLGNKKSCADSRIPTSKSLFCSVVVDCDCS